MNDPDTFLCLFLVFGSAFSLHFSVPGQHYSQIIVRSVMSEKWARSRSFVHFVYLVDSYWKFTEESKKVGKQV